MTTPPSPPSATLFTTPATTPAEPDRRATVVHPSLKRTLRTALELTARDLPEFDAGMRRMLVARYRVEEGSVAATHASRAKSRVLANEAAFRSMLPRIVALGLNDAFQRLDGHPSRAIRPEDGSPARAATIAAFARGFAADEPDGLAELERRLAHQLGRATLAPGDNPLRPAVFLHAVGACWRAVAGGDGDELAVMNAYGVLWRPALRRTIGALVAGLPPAPGGRARGATPTPGSADVPPVGSTIERWASAMGLPSGAPPPSGVAPSTQAAKPAPPAAPSIPAEAVERLRAGFGAPPRDPRAAPA
jgi:hypothetical protein